MDPLSSTTPPSTQPPRPTHHLSTLRNRARMRSHSARNERRWWSDNGGGGASASGSSGSGGGGGAGSSDSSGGSSSESSNGGSVGSGGAVSGSAAGGATQVASAGRGGSSATGGTGTLGGTGSTASGGQSSGSALSGAGSASTAGSSVATSSLGTQSPVPSNALSSGVFPTATSSPSGSLSTAAFPTPTPGQNSTLVVSVVGRGGFDSTGIGLVATLIFALLLALLLFLCFRWHSRHRPTSSRPLCHPHEIVAPRLFHAPSSLSPPPLPPSRLEWFFPFLFPGGRQNRSRQSSHHSASNVVPFFPRYPDISGSASFQIEGQGHSRKWLPDAEIHVRTVAFLTSVVVIWSVWTLGLALPLITVGIPSLSAYASGAIGINSGTVIGSYSTLDDWGLLRLLHAYDSGIVIEGLSITIRFLLLLIVGLIIPTLVILFFLYHELRKTEKHQKAFRESAEGGKGSEIAFLRIDTEDWKERAANLERAERARVVAWRGARRNGAGAGVVGFGNRGQQREEEQTSSLTGLSALGELRLREVFNACGLGPEDSKKRRRRRNSALGHERRTSRDSNGVVYAEVDVLDAYPEPATSPKQVQVDSVYGIPDLTLLQNLTAQREVVIDQLESFICRYIACFESVSESDELRLTKVQGPRSKKSSGGSSRRSRKAKDTAKAIPYAPSQHYHLTERRKDHIPDSLTPKLEDQIGRHLTGASFTEVGLNEKRWELGDQVRVNEVGRLSRLNPDLVAEETVDGDIVTSDSATEKPRPSVSFEDSAARPELHNTIAFPTYPVAYPEAGPSTSPADTFPPYPSQPTLPLMMPTTAYLGAASGPYGYHYPSSGFGGLATLEESEEENEDSSSDEGDYDSTEIGHGASQYDERGRSLATTPDTPLPISIPKSAERPRVSIDQSTIGATPTPDINTIPLIETDSDDEELYLSSRTATHEIEAMDDTNRFSIRSRRRLSRPRTPKTSKASSEEDATSEPLSPFHHYQPTLRPIVTEAEVASIYAEIRQRRSDLKSLNNSIGELQSVTMAEVGEGKGSKEGFVLVGKGVSRISGAEPLAGRTKDDLRWDYLSCKEPRARRRKYWVSIFILCLGLEAFLIVPSALAVCESPGFANVWSFFQPLIDSGKIPVSITTILAPAIYVILLYITAIYLVIRFANENGGPSAAATQLLALEGILWLIVPFVVWSILFGAISSASSNIQTSTAISKSLADGAIATGSWLFGTLILLAVFYPIWLVLRPLEMWKKRKLLKDTKTPRQRFIALKPSPNSPIHLFGFLFLALSSSVIFLVVSPLVAAPLVVLFLLYLVVLRHNSTYVHLRAFETNGTYSIIIYKAVAIILILPSIFLGLLFLSRHLIALGTISIVFAFVLLAAFIIYEYQRRQESSKLNAETQKALESFNLGACDGSFAEEDERSVARSSLIGRRSMASVFELMNTIAPNQQRLNPGLPLESEVVDPFIHGAVVARAHPGVHLLPPLSFDDTTPRGNDTMYPPCLTSPRPIVILPNDPLAREEALYLEKYWGVKAIWESSPGLDFYPGLNVERGARRTDTVVEKEVQRTF